MWSSNEVENARVCLLMIGRRKAAVFPEPGRALVIRSLPAIIIGIACFCTGVGILYPASMRFFFNNGLKQASSNPLIAFTTLSPVTDTELFPLCIISLVEVNQAIISL